MKPTTPKEKAWEEWLLTHNFHTGQAMDALQHSSHGQTFSCAWDTATRLCREECAVVVEQAGVDGLGTLAAAAMIRTLK